jgi:hypothetical protein
VHLVDDVVGRRLSDCCQRWHRGRDGGRRRVRRYDVARIRIDALERAAGIVRPKCRIIDDRETVLVPRGHAADVGRVVGGVRRIGGEVQRGVRGRRIIAQEQLTTVALGAQTRKLAPAPLGSKLHPMPEVGTLLERRILNGAGHGYDPGDQRPTS